MRISVTIFWLAIASSARAQEAPPPEEPPPEQPPPPEEPSVVQARERLERGEELFAHGDYDGALAEYESAYQIIGEHPTRYMMLYNIARAHERRFRYDLALQYYRRYLDEGGERAPRREAVLGTLETLEGLLSTIHVRVNVEEAEVWREDRQVGVAPGDVLVPGGRHALEVRAAGYETARREVQIAARAEETLFVELRPLAEEYRGFDPAIFFGVVAGAGASLVAGAVVGLYAVVRRGELLEMSERMREDRRDEMRAITITADVLMFGVTGLLLGAALVIAFLTDWRSEESSRAIRVGPGALEVVW